VTLSHPATPDEGSLAVKAKSTGWVHQLLWSGGRPGTAPVMTGGVLSTRITTVVSVLASVHVTRQPSENPVGGESASNVFVPQLLVCISDPGSQSHVRRTSALCQPEQSGNGVPGGDSQSGVTEYACAAAGPPAANATAMSPSGGNSRITRRYGEVEACRKSPQMKDPSAIRASRR
jgi:hypothetical protein